MVSTPTCLNEMVDSLVVGLHYLGGNMQQDGMKHIANGLAARPEHITEDMSIRASTDFQLEDYAFPPTKRLGDAELREVIFQNRGDAPTYHTLVKSDQHLLTTLLHHQHYISVQLPAPGEENLPRCIATSAWGRLTTALRIETDWTVHLSRVESRDGAPTVSIHVTTPAYAPRGARYTHLNLRTFAKMGSGSDWGAVGSDVSTLLDITSKYLVHRLSFPLAIQATIQGYHELPERQQTGGLADTGGQDNYVNAISHVLAGYGVESLIFNRGGVAHPRHGDVRTGFHVGPDAMLVFLHDGSSKFVRKEQMWEGDHIPKMVRHADQFLTQLQCGGYLSARPFAFGLAHYIDGTTFLSQLRDKISPKFGCFPIMNLLHSLGSYKRDCYSSLGKPIDDNLNMASRLKQENRMYAKDKLQENDRIFAVSPDILQSFIDQLDFEPHGLAPAGVDERFTPRPLDSVRTDRHYDHVWKRLMKYSVDNNCGPKDLSRLKNGLLIFEASRPDYAKGKDIQLRAFAQLLREWPEDKPEPFFILNLGDKSTFTPDTDEARHVESLHDYVDELGIRERVIYNSFFELEEIVELQQIVDLYFSAARLEPWGMSVAQAAAAQLPILCNWKVGVAESTLIHQPGSTRRHEPDFDADYLYTGSGVMLFKMLSDDQGIAAAAKGLSRLLSNSKLRADLGRVARERTKAMSWAGLAQKIMESMGIRLLVDKSMGNGYRLRDWDLPQ